MKTRYVCRATKASEDPHAHGTHTRQDEGIKNVSMSSQSQSPLASCVSVMCNCVDLYQQHWQWVREKEKNVGFFVWRKKKWNLYFGVVSESHVAYACIICNKYWFLRVFVSVYRHLKVWKKCIRVTLRHMLVVFHVPKIKSVEIDDANVCTPVDISFDLTKNDTKRATATSYMLQ